MCGTELAAELLYSIAAVYDWPDFRVLEKQVVRVDPEKLKPYTSASTKWHREFARRVLVVSRSSEVLVVRPDLPELEFGLPGYEDGHFATPAHAVCALDGRRVFYLLVQPLQLLPV